MCSTNQRTCRLVAASAIAVVVTAACLPGSGVGRAAAAVRGIDTKIPAGLAVAIHARLGAGTIRSSLAALATSGPVLGYSVALSADGATALVGAPGVALDRGAAYIFHVSGAGSWSSSWSPAATLMYKGASGKREFYIGWAVALSADGTTAFVAAPGTGDVTGAIYVFHVPAEDAWVSSSTPTATLKASQGLLVGWGLALSPDGTTLIAGAPANHFGAGGAYVFHASSESAWASSSTPIATLSNADEAGGDGGVGSAVAISADGTIALLSDSGNPSGGGAFLYHVSAANAWKSSSKPTAILSDANSGRWDALGNAVALSGDGTLAFLGAPGANSAAGAAEVFRASAEAAWTSTSTPTAILTNAGGSALDSFGGSVALSTDGRTALAAAPRGSAARGAAYIFRASGEAAWASSSAPTATLTDSAGHPKDYLGGSGVLSVDGATALLGVPGVQLQTGAADVFHVSDASSWASTSTPNATLTVEALGACVVPKLKGLSLSAAKWSLWAGRCRLGKVTKVHAKTKKTRSRVLSQNPKPGRLLAIGAKVAVKVGK
jgi:hypothetical protein